jgi:hypothetical protein
VEAAALATQNQMATEDMEANGITLQESRQLNLNSARNHDNTERVSQLNSKGNRKLNQSSTKKGQPQYMEVVGIDEITIEDAGQRTMNMPSNEGAPMMALGTTPTFHQTEVKKKSHHHHTNTTDES